MAYPSNLPSVTELVSPAFVYQVNWHPEINNDVQTQPVQSGDPVADIELVKSNWKFIANPDNFVDLGGSGGGRFAGRTSAITRFCSQVWCSTQVGDLWHSSDGGKTFEKNIENLTSDAAIFTSYDSSGRLWRIDDVGTQPFAVYRSNSGKGDDWEEIFAPIGSNFITPGGSFTSGRGIVTHPKDKNIAAFAAVNFDDFPQIPYAYITKDSGSSWSQIELPQNSQGAFPPEPYGIYDITFTESGRLIVLFENFENDDPFENYYFADWSDDYESFNLNELLPEFRTIGAGFTGRLTTIGNEVFAAFSQDHDSSISPIGFDGLVTHVAKSSDNGGSYEELARFTQPINQVVDMPGYPMGLIYDSRKKLLYIFFSSFSLAQDELEFDPGLFIQVVDEGGNKSIATDPIEKTGMSIPFSLQTSVSPQRTSFGITQGVNLPKGLLRGGDLSNLPAPDALCGGL